MDEKTPIPIREYYQQTLFFSYHYVTFGMLNKQMVNVNYGIKALCFDERAVVFVYSPMGQVIIG
ncbi:hypothetical protein [Pinibacter aurantiacus]|uniref:Uncharacterized protein n=1 Tax=Pinibacter aurantiacus TaxID=2851599 RepID=A0A9E2W3J2_9BACT|nr:hypothetical protein [Pinibacter aurantiacus]MBV4356839.1 hypothetical protein [Pinibacter aurantiacus]